MQRETMSLDPTRPEVRFRNGTSLLGAAAVGQVTQFVPAASALRGGRVPAEQDTTSEFDRALKEVGLVEQETIYLDLATPPAGLRGGTGSDEVTLVPARADGDSTPRVVLYQDESGGLSWHYDAGASLTEEEREHRRRRGLRAPRPGEFRIPLRTAQAGRALAPGLPRRSLRGPISKIGRKILKVFLVPVAGLFADPVEQIVGAVERRVHHDRIWRLTPATYATAPTAGFQDWQSLRGKRCLLVVHGILSSVEGMLSRLPQASMTRWSDAYGGRVLGLNHRSITLSPEDNARFFLEQVHAALPDDGVDVDIVCHSRGGIVARTLVERGRELFPASKCRFGKVFFVATPNQGSVLGDPEHMVDMIDLFTNFLTNFPDGPVLYSIEILLAMVKLLATAVGNHLPGVESMGTQSYIKTVLNKGAAAVGTTYAAVAADYAPTRGTDNAYLLRRFADAAVDRIFYKGEQAVANDLVVPFEGVWGANGHPAFPITDPLLFQRDAGVWHSGFFARQETTDAIDQFLGLATAPLELDTRPEPGVSAVASPEQPRTARRRGRRGSGTGGAGAPEAGPAATPAAGGTTVEREPSIQFHEQVTEGDTYPLKAELRESHDLDAWSIQLAPDTDEFAITAEISAPGFEVQSPRSVPLVVKKIREPATETASFLLRATHPGPEPVTRDIVVTFWAGNSALGTVRHYTVVVPKGYAGVAPADGRSRHDGFRIPPRRRESPDVVIYVRRLDRADESYSLSMRSMIEAEEYEDQPFGTFSLDGRDMTAYFSQAIDPIFNAFPGGQLSEADFDRALATWNTRLMTDLRDLGARLWQLLPSGFRTEYLRLMNLANPPRSFGIHSDEMIFPWELVRPTGIVGGKYQELPVLGISHILGRWKVGLSARPQPQAVPRPRTVIVNPQYANGDDLPWSTDERNEIQKLLTDVEVVDPVTRATIDQLLARADVQLVHFTGHGDWDAGTNADLSALRLENGDRMRAIAFAANRLGAEGHPILCLNACTIGRIGQVMGRPGGFASNCLDGGWAGVIAPYWPVYDPKAYEFSLKLYGKLKFRRSIGEALQEIRSESPDDPTALSYSYFGDPFARLLFT